MLSYTTLQEGYKVPRSLSDAHKESLQKDLQEISVADSNWLDTDANLVEKEVARPTEKC